MGANDIKRLWTDCKTHFGYERTCGCSFGAEFRGAVTTWSPDPSGQQPLYYTYKVLFKLALFADEAFCT
jgi:hypothetical protein